MVDYRKEFRKIFCCKYYITYKIEVIRNRPDLPFLKYTTSVNKYSLRQYIMRDNKNNSGYKVRVLKVNKTYATITASIMYKILAISSNYGINGFDLKAKDLIYNIYKTLVNYYKETKNEKFREEIKELFKEGD